MTIYRESNSDYIFQHPHPGPLNVTIFNNQGEELRKVQALTPVAGRYTVRLNYTETRYDGNLLFEWTGAGGFSRKVTAEVVTPLLPLNVVKTLFDDIRSDIELQNVENSVRLVIEAYTGQKFGLTKEVRDGRAVNFTRMSVDKPLVSIDEKTPGFWVKSAMLSQDGRNILLPSVTYMDIKDAPPEELIGATTVGGVIRVPNHYYSFTPDGYYRIYGEWGYTHVPEDVQEAAKILINDYACGESIYRERYLESVKFENTLTFHPLAFQGTGNVRVDQILDKYKRIKAGVV